ncbi:hypothetical protein CLOBL_03680 [Clostridium sp. BL-8]|nr:hypothetical protein CLOBL_03680 [Clostridium sp. BL-8]
MPLHRIYESVKSSKKIFEYVADNAGAQLKLYGKVH